MIGSRHLPDARHRRRGAVTPYVLLDPQARPFKRPLSVRSRAFAGASGDGRGAPLAVLPGTAGAAKSPLPE